MATDWGSVSSTASPSAVETDLEVSLKRRQWVVIKYQRSAVSGQPSAFSLVFAPGYRHKVAKAHRHKAEKNTERDMTLSLCHSVPLSLKLSASGDSELLCFCLFFFGPLHFSLDERDQCRAFHQVPHFFVEV